MGQYYYPIGIVGPQWRCNIMSNTIMILEESNYDIRI